jgi:hypothetical protein
LALKGLSLPFGKSIIGFHNTATWLKISN